MTYLKINGAAIPPKDKKTLHNFLLSPIHANMIASIQRRTKAKSKVDVLRKIIEAAYSAQNAIDEQPVREEDLPEGEQRAVSKSKSPTGIGSNLSHIGYVQNGRVVRTRR